MVPKIEMSLFAPDLNYHVNGAVSPSFVLLTAFITDSLHYITSK